METLEKSISPIAVSMEIGSRHRKTTDKTESELKIISGSRKIQGKNNKKTQGWDCCSTRQNKGPNHPGKGKHRCQEWPRRCEPSRNPSLVGEWPDGHFGVIRTIEKCQMRFYWPHRKEDAKSWSRKCAACKRPQKLGLQCGNTILETLLRKPSM